MKFVFITLILCSFIMPTKADEFAYGLKFISSDRLVSERTSMTLFPSFNQSFTEKFSLSFLFKFNDLKYGYILRISDGSVEYTLNFITFRNNNYSYIDFNIGDQNIGQLSLPKTLIDKEQVSTFKISFDLVNRKVILSAFNQEVTLPIEKLPGKMKPCFYFGLHGTNLDVAPFSLKDIKIFNSKDKLVYCWPLNEKTGEVSYDIVKNEKAEIKNPNWIARNHFFWEKLNSYIVEVDADVTFDQARNQVLVVTKDSLIKFSLNEGTTQVIRYKNSNPILYEGFNVMYNERLKQLESYIFYIPNSNSKIPAYSIYNEKLRLWNNPDPATPLTLFWHHAAFFMDKGSTIGLFGGYGDFKYYNTFLFYNRNKQDWDTLSFKGDTICPRFFSGIGSAGDDKTYYLFGGFGNNNGHQEYGGRNLYDLFKVDVKSRTIQKIFELRPLSNGLPFVVAKNLLVDTLSHSLFGLMFPHHQPNTFLALMKIDLINPTFQIVSDSIPIKSERIKTHAKLFQTLDRRFFVTVIKERDVLKNFARIGIYTVKAPPYDSNLNLRYQSQSNISLTAKFIFIATMFILLSTIMLIVVYKIARKKKSLSQVRNLLPLSDNIKVNTTILADCKSNSLYIFGNILVIDKKGKDITYLFPPKIAQALCLLIIESAIGTEGLSSSDFSKKLWPDKDFDHTKNIRGVTLNHLRNSLEDIEGIRLVYNEKKKWHFECNNEFYCDYFDYKKLISSRDLSKTELVDKMLPILKRGILLPNIENPCFDFYKNQVENSIIELFLDEGERQLINNDYAKTNELMDVLYHFSLLNESVLSLKIKALIKLGKIEPAKTHFYNFCSAYKKVLETDYNRNFKDFF